MNVQLIYIHPRANQRVYIGAARRFVDSYQKFPPGATDHDINVFINGDEPNRGDERLFQNLSVRFHQHNNFGKDIGAFQVAAGKIDCDLMVFLGSHIHFRQAGWLDLMVNAFLKNGPGIYGAYGFHQPALHLRTTAFWMPPQLLNAYPMAVDNAHRYEFEHGRDRGISKWVIDSGFNAWMVTWSGVYPPESWRHVENHEALLLDQHSDRIGYK